MKFYRVHMGGGRFETWCQDHARRDLDRGKRLREVAGPCAVCPKPEPAGPTRPNDRRCALCRCAAVAEVHGFPVCDYHATRGEDDPPCPACF